MSWRPVAVFALVIAAAVGAWVLFSEHGTKPDAPTAPQGDAAEVRGRTSAPSGLRPESHIRPRRLVESAEPEQPPPPVTDEIVVTVVDSESQPIAGAVATSVAVGPEDTTVTVPLQSRGPSDASAETVWPGSAGGKGAASAGLS
jgi:hypothetical protein